MSTCARSRIIWSSASADISSAARTPARRFSASISRPARSRARSLSRRRLSIACSGGGTSRVRLVRGRDESCPVSTGEDGAWSTSTEWGGVGGRRGVSGRAQRRGRRTRGPCELKTPLVDACKTKTHRTATPRCVATHRRAVGQAWQAGTRGGGGGGVWGGGGGACACRSKSASTGSSSLSSCRAAVAGYARMTPHARAPHFRGGARGSVTGDRHRAPPARAPRFRGVGGRESDVEHHERALIEQEIPEVRREPPHREPFRARREHFAPQCLPLAVDLQ